MLDGCLPPPPPSPHPPKKKSGSQFRINIGERCLTKYWTLTIYGVCVCV